MSARLDVDVLALVGNEPDFRLVRGRRRRSPTWSSGLGVGKLITVRVRSDTRFGTRVDACGLLHGLGPAATAPRRDEMLMDEIRRPRVSAGTVFRIAMDSRSDVPGDRVLGTGAAVRWKAISAPPLADCSSARSADQLGDLSSTSQRSSTTAVGADSSGSTRSWSSRADAREFVEGLDIERRKHRHVPRGSTHGGRDRRRGRLEYLREAERRGRVLTGSSVSVAQDARRRASSRSVRPSRRSSPTRTM